MTAGDWAIFIKSLDRCSDRRGGCAGCWKIQRCLRNMDAKSELFKDYAVVLVEREGVPDPNPCIGEFRIGLHLPPISILDVRGCGLVGTGDCRKKWQEIQRQTRRNHHKKVKSAQ
jgi:hypothetical protein